MSQELGLDYPIKLPDEFSANFTRLLNFIKETRAEFAAMRAEMQRLGIKPSEELSKEALARKKAAQAAKEQERASKEAQKQITKAALDSAKAQKEAAKLSKATADALTAQAKAATAASKATAAQATATAQAAQQTANAHAAQARAAAAASRATIAQTAAANAAARAQRTATTGIVTGAQQATAAINTAQAATSRWVFTFRRLVGIFAIFQGVRLVIGSIRETIRDAIEFNATLEDTTIGIASLLVSVGQVRDAFGNAVAPAQQLALAQVEAQRQVRLLRVEALKTSATFKGLAETFQVAVGPGLAAGLNLTEIRRLTVRISQSAAALGLPQNQLPEEIRSLLTGAIQQRTTRIASALGIDNEDIRLAKEAGKLSEFLETKFKSFALAADEASSNFTIVLSNLRDAFEQLIGQGSIAFFTELKALLRDLQNVMVSVTAEGVGINPEAGKIVAAIAAGLTTAAQQARQLVRDLGPENLLRIATAFGNIIGAISRLITFAVEVFTEFAGGISAVVNLFSDLINFVRPLAGLMSPIVAFAIKWYLTTKLLATTIGTIVKLVMTLAPVWATLFASTQIGGLGGVAFALKEVFLSLNGIAIAAGAVVLVATVLGSAFSKAGDEARDAASSVKDMKQAVEEIPSIVASANQPLRDNGELVKKLTEELNKALDNLRDTIATLGSKGSAAEDIKALLAIDSELRDQGKELMSELNAKQKEHLGLLEREHQIQTQIRQSTLFKRNAFERLLPLYREALQLRDRQLILEQQIKTTVGSEQTALQKELSKTLNRLEDISDETEHLGVQVNRVLEDRANEVQSIDHFRIIEKEVQDLIVDELTTKGAIAAVDARIRDLTEQRKRLVAEIADIQVSKVLASGLQEEQTQRRRLLQERALNAAQRARIEFARIEESQGFRSGEGSKALAAAQAEQIIARQKLAELGNEQRIEEAGIRRAIDLLQIREADLAATRDASTLDEDRTKAGEALTRAVAARESLERKLASTQITNSAQLQTERLRVNQILLDALQTIRRTATLETEAAKQKTAAALASFDAEKAKLSILDREQEQGFRLAETERQILELQSDLAPTRARLELTRQEQLIGEREVENEITSLRLTGQRLAIQATILRGTGEGLQAVLDLTEVTRTLQLAEERLAQLRAQNAAELADAAAKSVISQRAALTGIARQAENERLVADQRAQGARAVLAIEQRRSEVLKADAETGFLLTDAAKRLLEIETDTSAARLRLDLARETQEIQERGIEGTIKAAEALEAGLTSELAMSKDVAKRAALERVINSTMATRLILEASLGKIRTANLTEFSVELAKLRNNNLALLASISSEAVRETRGLDIETSKQEAENIAERTRLAALGNRLLIESSNERLRIEEKIKIAEADLGPIEAQIAAQERLNAEKIKTVELTLSTLRASVERDKAALPGAGKDAPALSEKIVAEEQTIADLEAQLVSLRAANNAQLDDQVAKLDLAKRKLEELKAIADQPFALGAEQGLKNFTDKAVDHFSNMAALVEGTLDNLASTISNALVDAFDPNADSTIKERFQQFFSQLAREIATMIIRLQIAKALIGLGFADGGEVPTRAELAVGRARGGYVPQRGRPSLAHVRAPGYARGGRPSGLDPRDTVPIWAQPGEWVMRLAAVRKYGENTMAAINEGLVDPSALRSATDGARSKVQSTSVNRVGYATGGAVASGSEGGPGLQLGVIVATPEQFSRLLKGGRRAQMEFMAENREEIKASLRI